MVHSNRDVQCKFTYKYSFSGSLVHMKPTTTVDLLTKNVCTCKQRARKRNAEGVGVAMQTNNNEVVATQEESGILTMMLQAVGNSGNSLRATIRAALVFVLDSTSTVFELALRFVVSGS